MTAVGTAELKAHLSKHLRAVRAGETIIVLDRNSPIARIVPYGEGNYDDLVIVPGRGRIQDVLVPPKPVGVNVDSLAALLEERADRL